MQLKMKLLKTVYDELVTKVNSIDTSRFLLKTKYCTDESNSEKKIPDPNRLLKNRLQS